MERESQLNDGLVRRPELPPCPERRKRTAFDGIIAPSEQRVCPWNVSFARELKEPAFAPRAVLAGKDARDLARELLAMSQEDFRVGFKGSPMKRAKLRGLKRNAAVVLGNVGTAEDVDVLTRARQGEDPPVREHAAWALERLGVVRSDAF